MNQKNQGIAGKKKTSVLLHLDTSHQRKEDGKSRFYLKVRVQGKPQLYDILPEVHMDRKYWIHETDESGAEKKKMRIQHSKGNPDSRRLEVTLLGKLGEMTAIIEDLGNQGHAVTHAMIGQRWKGTGIKTLFEYIEARMEDERAEVRASTFIKWRSCLRAIRAYDPQVLLTEVTPEWLRGYEEYLRHMKPHARILEIDGSERVVKGKGKGLGQNAIVGNFKFLSKYLRDALVRNFITKNPMEVFRHETKARKRLQWVTPNRNILSESEIGRLHEAYEGKELLNLFPKGSKGIKLHNVLQQVLAAIYSGFRFSDIAQFQDQMKMTVTDTHLKLTMRKVNKQQTIKITQKLRSVLSLENGGSLFDAPIMTNSSMNTNLRKILDCLGIEKYLSWHDLRRTFASHLQSMNVDIKKVSKLLGHSSVVVTEKYVKTQDYDLDRAMDVWDDEPASPTGMADRKLMGLVVDLVEENPGLVLPTELAAMLVQYRRAM